MSKKDSILRGTLILTFSGFLCRIIGFLFRIFLSRTLGAEKLGIYQLVFPVFGICFALCCGAYQTAISRYVASTSSGDHKGHGCSGTSSLHFVLAGALLSVSSGILLCIILMKNSAFIAKYFLLEPRCERLIYWLSFSLPFASLNACICGYYIGRKKLIIPGISQIIEQLARVIFIFALWCSYEQNGTGQELTPLSVVIAMVIGEACATLFLFLCISASRKATLFSGSPAGAFRCAFRHIILLILPLIGTRLILHLLQGAESILVPNSLKAFGYSPTEALSLFGILNGMAFPFIMFPGTVINSLAVVLLPHVAEADARSDTQKLQHVISKSLSIALSIGIFSSTVFLCYGKEIGAVIYHEPIAGTYIQALALICPFMYMAGTTSSTLNGLGNVRATLIHNCLVSVFSIVVVVGFIPHFGMRAYLIGLLFNQILLSFLNLRILYKKIAMPFDWLQMVGIPCLWAIVCVLPLHKATQIMQAALKLSPVWTMLIACLLSTLLFALLVFSRKEQSPTEVNSSV